MKFLNLLLIGAVAVLTGCAASGPKFSVAEATTPKLNADQGRVYFYRNSSMLGAGLQPSVVLDGANVGNSQQGGYFYVDTAAGNHVAVTSTETDNKVSFVLDKGEVKYVRTAVSMGVLVGHVVPTLVGSDEATKELAELSYTGAIVK